MRRRTDESDVIQQTFIEVNRDLADFHGDTEVAWNAWISAILRNKTAHTNERHVHAQKRSVKAEVHLDDSHINGGALRDKLPGSDPSPSYSSVRKELAEFVQCAMSKLTAEQRQVIILRFFSQQSLVEISKAIGKSMTATAAFSSEGRNGFGKNWATILSTTCRSADG